MEETIARLQEAGERKRLLLHACCAPCSTYCLETLVPHFDVTVLFYNPNITETEEYEKRLAEEKRLIAIFNDRYRVRILEARHDPEAFFAVARGLEKEPEGGERCRRCFTLRLNEAARVAKDADFDFFTTTLTISPLKNADMLNEAGQQAAGRYGVPFLPSDFKKKNGFRRSVELSEAYGLYRQDYCGCVYSKAERSCAKCRKQDTAQCPEGDA